MVPFRGDACVKAEAAVQAVLAVGLLPALCLGLAGRSASLMAVSETVWLTDCLMLGLLETGACDGCLRRQCLLICVKHAV
jgi:hypothetical protein